jgi:hypothetical protein
VADSLSRPGGLLAAVEPLPPPLDWLELAAAQAADQQLLPSLSDSSLQLTTHLLPDSTPLTGDISTGHFRPIVPPPFRRRVFEMLHGMAHPGVRNIYLRLDMFTQPSFLLKYIQSPTLPLLFNIATTH